MFRRATFAALAAIGITHVAPGTGAGSAQAQAPARNQVVMMREIDADRYDPHRSTALAAGEALTLMSDTLVNLDYDMRTLRPGLAERWEVSPDGLVYTFHLRRDVTFCDGKPFTAADMAFSLNRWIGRTTPRATSPVAWRAGDVKEITATDSHTLRYELNRPFSELLSQLTLFFAVAVDPATVERLGDNFGVQGFNGTGPYCWGSWTPRQDLVMNRHAAYRWGPDFYQNRGPAHLERITWRVVPEAASRVAALQSNQADIVSGSYIPWAFHEALTRAPGITRSAQPNYFWDVYIGFKVDKPVVNDPALRRAIHMAVDRPAMVRAVYAGTAEAARNIVNPRALDFDAQSEAMVPAFDRVAAGRALDEAGWRMGPDNVRVKDGQRATFLLYGINTLDNQRLSEITQQQLRQVGIEMRVQLFDATVAWGRMATQEPDAIILSYPYISAGDALNLYWHSRNRPTPNRMNWNNPQTDAWLEEGRAALTDDVRIAAFANIQRQLAQEAPWLTLARTPMVTFSSNRVSGARAYGLYGIAIHKALDIRTTR
jgi:peptide/nickel transport system substrate-binding protein